MQTKIRLAALDMDGTLFNQHSQISPENQKAIRYAVENGVEVVISTGRPYVGLPVEFLSQLGIRYAITSNGASIYHLPDKKLLHAICMEPELVCPILHELQKKDIHMDVFIDGNSYSRRTCRAGIDRLDVPDSIRRYIRETRTFIDDPVAFIEERNLPVEKMTLNFYPLADGTFLHREEVKTLLSSYPDIMFLTGGYHNLELTRTGTTKGNGLRFLCDYLSIPLTQTLACGDTQNDLDILETAAIGVAMGNARQDVKDAADFVTLSNEEHGVAYALYHYIDGGHSQQIVPPPATYSPS